MDSIRTASPYDDVRARFTLMGFRSFSPKILKSQVTVSPWVFLRSRVGHGQQCVKLLLIKFAVVLKDAVKRVTIQ